MILTDYLFLRVPFVSSIMVYYIITITSQLNFPRGKLKLVICVSEHQNINDTTLVP